MHFKIAYRFIRVLGQQGACECRMRAARARKATIKIEHMWLCSRIYHPFVMVFMPHQVINGANSLNKASFRKLELLQE